jgi:hypothetical protein
MIETGDDVLEGQKKPNSTHLGLSCGGDLRDLEFFVDCLLRFRRNLDEFDAYSDTLQTVTDFTAGYNFEVRAWQLKTDSQNGTFGKMIRGIDEHSRRTDVGSAESDFFRRAFTGD